jgi:hypothetical protein
VNSNAKKFAAFLCSGAAPHSKASLAQAAAKNFQLIRDRSVFHCRDFAVRFSSAAGPSFSNTVLSLSNLKKYDGRPFFVCLATPGSNYVFLANSTFLKKISHSSQALRVDNVRGSFNGSDILRKYPDASGAFLDNEASNFDKLFSIHANTGFDVNLVRLAAATSGIQPTGTKFCPDQAQQAAILQAPVRTVDFFQSPHARELENTLGRRVRRYHDDILRAACINNGNVRGRLIEYLIAGKDARVRKQIVDGLRKKNGTRWPEIRMEHTLGDYKKQLGPYFTLTDVKTKDAEGASNPKAYNLDKMLEFLSKDGSVLLFYFVGISSDAVTTALVPVFQEQLLEDTSLIQHWAGRNSRGVSQFKGETIDQLLENRSSSVNTAKAYAFLKKIIAL